MILFFLLPILLPIGILLLDPLTDPFQDGECALDKFIKIPVKVAKYLILFPIAALLYTIYMIYIGIELLIAKIVPILCKYILRGGLI
jgi:hypothetical protein